MNRRRVTETLGWYGVGAILGAYAANSFGILDVGSVLYTLLNLTGALALIADSWPDRNWQVIALNSVWAAVALFSITR